MDYKLFLIELIKYGAWPLVAVTACFLFEEKIGRIVGGGLKSVKHGESEATFYPNSQTEAAEATNTLDSSPLRPSDFANAPFHINGSDETENFAHFIPSDITDLLEDFSEGIYAQIEPIKDEGEKVDILVKNLAHQQISNKFERVYHLIFGSQIRLLENLAGQAGGRASIQLALSYFDSAKYKNPEFYESSLFTDYMKFLYTFHLVKNEDDELSITKHGRGFLKYISALELSKERAY